MSKPVKELLFQLWAMDIPNPVEELRFHKVRRWRFDLAWPAQKVAVEVQGGAWVRGRHHRPKGYRKDCEKLAFAVLDGWKVLWVVPEQIKSGEAIAWIVELLGDSPAEPVQQQQKAA